MVAEPLPVHLQAQADQTSAAMREATDDAMVVVAYYQTLVGGGLPAGLRNLLTERYSIYLLDTDEEEETE